MQLTKQTDYAVRALIYLSQHSGGELIQIKQICEFYDISANHLSKVILMLVNYGYVHSVRGKGGGVRLAVAASEINLAQVVRDCEPSLAVVNCDVPMCRINASCKLKGFLQAATQAFLSVLDNYTLEDLQDKALAKEFQTTLIKIIEV